MLLRDDCYAKISKQFHFTFVSRLQNLALSVIENLFCANDVFVTKTDIDSQKEWLSYQRSALTDLKVLGYVALLAMEQGCILPKQLSKAIDYILDHRVELMEFTNDTGISMDNSSCERSIRQLFVVI